MSNPERPIMANRDYPYHDYHAFSDTDEPTHYVVGTDNKLSSGDQNKNFVSKSTLLYSDVACTVQFNNAENVVIDIIADTWYEFKSNIHTLIVVTIATDGTLYAYFEGDFPQEARRPE